MITRFAPSPTGPLHLGHAYSAMLAQDLAQAAGGAFLLRIEDIDKGRARASWEAQIYDDLAWLGVQWRQPVMRQSERLKAYEGALNTLWDIGLLYPCTCNRRDIFEATSAPHGPDPRLGPDGLIYPGTCRNRPRPAQMPRDAALRLDMSQIDTPAVFVEIGPNAGAVNTPPQDLRNLIGDVVVSRRDMGTSYHLAVTVDDAAQGVTHVVRGQDLLEATAIHVVLQNLLGLPTPIYHHHRLITDDTGRRLAKRDDARAIAKYRDDGASPADIRRMVGLGSDGYFGSSLPPEA